MTMKGIDVLESPGIVRDRPPHRMKDSAFSDGSNVKFGQDGAEALAGDLATFSAAAITPLWIGTFPPITNPKWVYADLAQVFALEGTTHTEITRVSGVYSGLAQERWQSAVLNGVGILNNTVDLPQAWTDFSPTTPLVDLPNWTATRRAKSIRAYKNFLVALNMTDSGVERPYRVLWSDSAAPGTLPGSWDSTDPATDSREFDLAETSDHLVDSLPLGDVNIIYKEDSTWGMGYIGPPFYFRFWKILSKQGLLHRDCAASTPVGHIVVTQNDVILHNGQMENSVSVINSSMRKWLFQNIDPNNFRNCFLFPNVRNNEVWFCFPEVGETYATQALIWNWQEKSIGVRNLSPTPFVSVGPIGESTLEDLEWG